MFDDDEDMFDEENEENEISADPAPTPAISNVRPIHRSPISTNNKKKRQLRVRPMTPSMAEKHPEVVSIIMTRADGRQLMFVR